MNDLFSFVRVDNFLDDMNREDCFDTNDMDGVTPNYKIILVSECANDINDCLDEDGTLITPYDAESNKGANIVVTDGDDDGMLSLLWSKGINGERSISATETVVTYDLGVESVPVKGAFLVDIASGSGYVLAYAINNKAVELDENLICPIDGMLWAIHYGD